MTVSTVDYYFNAYDSGGDEWETDPEKMVDGSITTYAETTTHTDLQACNGNTCIGTDLGQILQVQLRTYGARYGSGSGFAYLTPKFSGTTESSVTNKMVNHDLGWSTRYFDITNIDGAPSSWTWEDIQNLDVILSAYILDEWVRIYKIEIHVIYSPMSTSIYSQGKNHLVELAMTIDASEKLRWADLLKNAGKVGTIDAPFSDLIHYDTTRDGSNTVTFSILDNPTGIPSSVTLFVESYSIQALVPNVTYRLLVRGFSS